MNGRHRKPKGMVVSTFELAVMILLGSLGVIMVVLAHRPWRSA